MSKSQADVDKEYNQWFAESFAAFFKEAIAPVIKQIDVSEDELCKLHDSLVEKVADRLDKLSGQIAELQTKQVETAATVTKLRTATSQVRTLNATVTKLQAEISTLRAALGRNVMLLPLNKERGDVA
jgi:phage shock protein A